MKRFATTLLALVLFARPAASHSRSYLRRRSIWLPM